MISFSIIIPVYNVAPYLRDAVDSVLSQTYSQWELICVDDGSTDGSREILDGYAKANAQIRVFHQRNAGVSSARNLALKEAKKEWVVFLDGDDMLASTTLQILAETIDRHAACDLVRFGHIDFHNADEIAWRGVKGVEKVGTAHSLSYCDVWKNLWEYAYRRDALPVEGFRPYTMGEDLLVLTQALCRSRALVRVDVPLYAYRNRPGSAVNSSFSLTKFMDHLGYLTDRFAALRESGKTIDPMIYRRIGLELTENAVALISQLSRKDRICAWTEFFALVDKMAECVEFTVWTRFVIRTLAGTRSKLLANVLCRAPFELKRRIK